MGPLGFYLIYIHCGDILKSTLGCTSHQVLSQNFIVGLLQLCRSLCLSFLSSKVYPIKILKFIAVVFFLVILSSPFLLELVSTPSQLLFFPAFFVLFIPDGFPAAPILYKHFPVLKRFTYSSLLFAISRAVMTVVASFGLVYLLVEHFGYWGIPILIIPFIIGYRWGVLHFEQLELSAGNSLQKASADLQARLA